MARRKKFELETWHIIVGVIVLLFLLVKSESRQAPLYGCGVNEPFCSSNAAVVTNEKNSCESAGYTCSINSDGCLVCEGGSDTGGAGDCPGVCAPFISLEGYKIDNSYDCPNPDDNCFVEDTSLVCEDTDGGKDKSTKGTVTYDGDSWTDSCYDTRVKEHYCYKNAHQYILMDCDNNHYCHEGACIPGGQVECEDNSDCGSGEVCVNEPDYGYNKICATDGIILESDRGKDYKTAGKVMKVGTNKECKDSCVPLAPKRLKECHIEQDYFGGAIKHDYVSCDEEVGEDYRCMKNNEGLAYCGKEDNGGGGNGGGGSGGGGSGGSGTSNVGDPCEDYEDCGSIGALYCNMGKCAECPYPVDLGGTWSNIVSPINIVLDVDVTGERCIPLGCTYIKTGGVMSIEDNPECCDGLMRKTVGEAASITIAGVPIGRREYGICKEATGFAKFMQEVISFLVDMGIPESWAKIAAIPAIMFGAMFAMMFFMMMMQMMMGMMQPPRY